MAPFDKVPSPPPPVITADLLATALLQLPAEKLREVLDRAGFGGPSVQGITPDQLQTILMTVGKTSAKAMQESLRNENPWYPERSVFNPRGLFDDAGKPQEPKLKFLLDTFWPAAVRQARAGETSELCTEEEIALFNRLAGLHEEKWISKPTGDWKVTFERRNSRERMHVDAPCYSNDDRMNLPPLTHILLELLEGPEAVRPEALLAQVKKLKEEVAALKVAQAAQVAA